MSLVKDIKYKRLSNKYVKLYDYLYNLTYLFDKKRKTYYFYKDNKVIIVCDMNTIFYSSWLIANHTKLFIGTMYEQKIIKLIINEILNTTNINSVFPIMLGGDRYIYFGRVYKKEYKILKFLSKIFEK